MPTLQSTSLYSGPLSNSCAEFVEHQAGPAVVRSVTTGSGDLPAQAPVFSKEQDRFVNLDQIIDVNKIYESSEKCMQQFQDTMKTFTTWLQGLEKIKKLGIEIRSPENYDGKYVLELAKTLMEKSENPGRFDVCNKFAMMCIKGHSKYPGVTQGLLDLIPTDVYGSLISGGFTLVCAAIEHAAKKRQDMKDALLKIPKICSRVQRLSEAHKKSELLHGRANSVLVSTFGVLQSIIFRLLTNFWSRNITKRKDALSKDVLSVDDAIEKLDGDVDDFHAELKVCMEHRFSRFEEEQGSIQKNVDHTMRLCEQIYAGLQRENPVKDQRIQRITNEAVNVAVYNLLYRFLGADGQFDTRTGQIIMSFNKQRGHLDPMKEIARNQQFLKTLLSQFDDPGTLLDAQVKAMLMNAERISLEDKDKLQYIIESDLFQGWLGEAKSASLTINAETPAGEVINYMSINTAMLYATLRSKSIQGRFAILGHFCDMRARCLDGSSSSNGPSTGLLDMLKSLNRQLLHFLHEESPYGDAPALLTKKMVQKAMTSREVAKNLLEKLLCLLPEDGVVVILLDSISCLGRDASKGDVFVDFLMELMEEFPQLNIKLLITNCFRSSTIRRVCRELCIPDQVDGWRLGINTKSLAERNRARFEEGVDAVTS